MSTFVLEGNPSPFQQYSYPAYSLEPTELDAVSRTCHGDKWQKKFSWRQLMCSKGPLHTAPRGGDKSKNQSFQILIKYIFLYSN